MYTKIVFFIGLIITTVLVAGLTTIDHKKESFGPSDYVYEVLQKLGDQPTAHAVDESVSGASAETGYQIITTGFAPKAGGGKARKQSRHFVCTSCHNIKKEDPDLRYSNPETRLDYALENKLPLLQGTTLYGIVNRESFYNDDYYKKYGDLVYPAQKDLREAIQLCATECAQGRPLKDWEMESVVAYLWTIQLKMSDLNLDAKALKTVNAGLNKSGKQAKAIETIRSFYQTKSPATFTDQPSNLKEGFLKEGNPERGKALYEISCQHCHANGRYSMFVLDNSKGTFKFLKRHFTKYTRYSSYHLTSYGTKPLAGKRAYMPNYTLEKMSQQQIEDLRAYFELKSK